MIAPGAEAIVKARLRGYKPDELLLVSMIGRLNESNHTILAKPGLVYDWRWAIGLRLCVYIARTVAWRDTVLAIAKSRPDRLSLWDPETHRGCNVFLKPSHPASENKPVKLWVWLLDFSNWQDCDNEDFSK